MIWLQLLLAVVGLAGLYYGADWLVEGSSRLAFRLGISPLIVGLTIVAFGTSSPELLVAMRANFGGSANLVVAPVVGSNIYNIALILGLGAMICPLHIPRQILVRDVPIMILATGLLLCFTVDQHIGRLEAGVLFGGLIGFLLLSASTSAKQIKESVASEFSEDDHPMSVARCILWIVLGITALAVGARLLVDSAEFIAKFFGVPDAIIGLTLIAFGTSLPELATVVVASLKKEGDIITGNIVGSNIFNIMGILGITALAKPIAYDSDLTVDLGFMAGITLLSLPLMITRKVLSRAEGALLLLVCMVYMYFVYQRL